MTLNKILLIYSNNKIPDKLLNAIKSRYSKQEVIICKSERDFIKYRYYNANATIIIFDETPFDVASLLTYFKNGDVAYTFKIDMTENDIIAETYSLELESIQDKIDQYTKYNTGISLYEYLVSNKDEEKEVETCGDFDCYEISAEDLAVEYISCAIKNYIESDDNITDSFHEKNWECIKQKICKYIARDMLKSENLGDDIEHYFAAISIISKTIRSIDRRFKK